MTEFNSKRTSDVYFSKKNGQYCFPELESNIVDNSKLAIAISGGGTRSMSASIGQFRCLLKHNKNFLDNVSYISSISGGSWFTSILTYSDYKLEELLGESVPLFDLKFHTLNSANYENEAYIGHVISNCSVFDSFYYANKRVRSDKVFQYVLGKVFLSKYNLQGKIPVIDMKHVKINEKINHISCICPIKKMPFVILGSAVIDAYYPNGNATDVSCLEFTPMYSGVRTINNKYGGLLFGNQSFGCNFKKLKHHNDYIDNFIVEREFGDNLLETAIACSGSAYSVELFNRKETVFGGILSKLNPKTQLWGVNSDKSYEVDITDGGYFDYTGITSLVARGTKKILSFLNCEEFNCNYCSFGVTHLFGMDQKYGCRGCELRNGNEIFSSRDFDDFKDDINHKMKHNKVLYHRKKLNVLKNDKVGVNGNYEVEIIFVILSRVKEFDDILHPELHNHEHLNYNNFPNYKMMFENDGSVLELFPTQVNLLSTFTDWCLSKVIKAESDFFEELNI